MREGTSKIGKKTFLGIKKIIPITSISASIIAPAAGFDSTEAFMDETSSAHAIVGNTIPYLALNALDDPLLLGKDLPRAEVRASSSTVLATTKNGGHLGWFGRWQDGTPEGRWSARVGGDWFTGIESLKLAARPVPDFTVTDDGWVYPVGRPYMGYQVLSRDTF